MLKKLLLASTLLVSGLMAYAYEGTPLTDYEAPTGTRTNATADTWNVGVITGFTTTGATTNLNLTTELNNQSMNWGYVAGNDIVAAPGTSITLNATVDTHWGYVALFSDVNENKNMECLVYSKDQAIGDNNPYKGGVSLSNSISIPANAADGDTYLVRIMFLTFTGTATTSVDYNGTYNEVIYWDFKVVVESPSAEYCTIPSYCTTEKSDANGGRYLNSITMTNQTTTDKTLTITSIETAAAHDIYHNLTADKVIEAYAGDEIKPSVDHSKSGDWLHCYMYVDYNRDGKFSDGVTDETDLHYPFVFVDNKPQEGSEIVSFPFYSPDETANGWNSKGEAQTSNNPKFPNKIPSFFIPEDLPAGDYRVRFLITWNELDPCAELWAPYNGDATATNNRIDKVGGSITDFTLRILPAPTTYYTVTFDGVAENGTFVIKDGDNILTSPAQVLASTTLTVETTPDTGYELDAITVNGAAITGNTFSVTGEMTVVVTFKEKEYTVNTSVRSKAEDIYPTSVNYTVSGETNSLYSATAFTNVHTLTNAITVKQGEQFSINIQGSFDDTKHIEAQIYADWNGDRDFVGAFDDSNIDWNTYSGQSSNPTPITSAGSGEWIYIYGRHCGNGSVDGISNLTHTFTVPDTATVGNMRIRFKYTGSWHNNPNNNTTEYPDVTKHGPNTTLFERGMIVDIPVTIVSGHHTVTVAVAAGQESRGSAYIGEEGTTSASVKEGEPLTITAKEGSFIQDGKFYYYEFQGFTLNGTLIENADYENVADAAGYKTIYNYTISSVMADANYEATFDTATGINEINGDASTYLYYAGGKVCTNMEGEIAIYNATGSLVRRANVAPVAVNDLPAGVYFVKVNGKSLKFVK